MSAGEYLAKVLRTKPEVLADLERKLNILTAKTGVFERIVEEKKTKIQSRLSSFGLTVDSRAEEIFKALVEKTRKEDAVLYELFNKPNFSTTDGCTNVIKTARELSGNIRGFFIKKEKAEELLKKNPPNNILRMLGYETIDALLAKEDLFEVF